MQRITLNLGGLTSTRVRPLGSLAPRLALGLKNSIRRLEEFAFRHDGIQTMPQDVKLSEEAAPRTAPKDSQSNNQRRWFTTPEPIKRLFNQFPLRTYPPNELPLRKSPDRTQHNLYIFATDNVAKLGLPSFNPGCLKWQVGRFKSAPGPAPNSYSDSDCKSPGVLEIPRNIVFHRPFEQSCITHRCTSVPSSRFVDVSTI